MKKILTILVLGLMIITSLAAGSMAIYTTSIDALAQGSAVAKEFVLLENGTDTFADNVKLAPTESRNWDFSIKNYNNNIVSETAMNLEVKVQLVNADGKTEIRPLVLQVWDNTDPLHPVLKGTSTGTGTIIINDSFPLQAQGQAKSYQVQIRWPGTDNTLDTQNAGSTHGSKINVSVTGTQA